MFAVQALKVGQLLLALDSPDDDSQVWRAGAVRL
jgi:hypothetical protein